MFSSQLLRECDNNLRTLFDPGLSHKVDIFIPNDFVPTIVAAYTPNNSSWRNLPRGAFKSTRRDRLVHKASPPRPFFLGGHTQDMRLQCGIDCRASVESYNIVNVDRFSSLQSKLIPLFNTSILG